MSFNINTLLIRDDLTDLIKNNLANVNSGLDRELSSINKINNFIYTGFPFNAPDLPQICIYQVSKDSEEFDGLGAGGRKNVIITLEITGITRIIKSSKIDTRYIDDTIKMANNIDYILRENIKFSSYILRSNPQSYEIIVNEYQTSTYVCMFKTQIVCVVDVIKCINC